MPVDRGIADLIGTGVNVASQALGARSNRRFTERQSALDALNQYQQDIATRMTFDPAELLRQALKGAYQSTAMSRVDPVFGKSIAQEMGPEAEQLIAALGQASTYNLTPQEGGGFQFKPWEFSPAVSSKYQKHLGDYFSGGERKKFGEGQTGRTYGA